MTIPAPGHHPAAGMSLPSISPSIEIPTSERYEDGHPLRLDYECLKSLPGGVNEVRVWFSKLLNKQLVGKRIDLLGLDPDILPEAATLESLDHRNIVPVRTAAEVGGFPKPLRVIEIVTPYYPRGSVTDALLRGETFTCSQAVAITQATLRGLSELHEVNGIVHRDMKSGNVLLTGDTSIARVADLGLAGRMDQSGLVIAQNNPTLYTPPEFFEVGQLGRHSDIYPVGLMLREMLAGNFSYENYTTTYIVEQLAKSRSPIRQADLVLPIWLPKDLCRIIRKAEHRSRFERYPTATAMDEALSRATFADWSAIDETAWEVTTPGRPDVRLKVEARELSGGAIRLSVRRLHTGWRRIFADQDVPALDSREARTVFDKATSIVAAR